MKLRNWVKLLLWKVMCPPFPYFDLWSTLKPARFVNFVIIFESKLISQNVLLKMPLETSAWVSLLADKLIAEMVRAFPWNEFVSIVVMTFCARLSFLNKRRLLNVKFEIYVISLLLKSISSKDRNDIYRKKTLWRANQHTVHTINYTTLYDQITLVGELR